MITDLKTDVLNLTQIETAANSIIDEFNEQLIKADKLASESADTAKLIRGAIQGIQMLYQKLATPSAEEENTDDNPKPISESLNNLVNKS